VGRSSREGHPENEINDPNLRCLPHAPPRMWASFAMQKLIQTPDSLTILDEYMGQYREIFLDGRPLPNDPEPTFKGYSVGRWEGDALVVETIGIKGNWFDAQGHPLTEQARLIERIRRVSYGNLEVEVTVDDPKAYTKPWTRTVKLILALNTELLEVICAVRPATGVVAMTGHGAGNVTAHSLQWGSQEGVSMIDKLHFAGLMAALGACLAAGCGTPAEKPQPSAQGGTAPSGESTVQSPVSVH
jgi:hypothetical protein